MTTFSALDLEPAPFELDITAHHDDDNTSFGNPLRMVDPPRQLKIEISQRGSVVLRLDAVRLDWDQPLGTFNPKAIQELVDAANETQKLRRQLSYWKARAKKAEQLDNDGDSHGD